MGRGRKWTLSWSVSGDASSETKSKKCLLELHGSVLPISQDALQILETSEL